MMTKLAAVLLAASLFVSAPLVLSATPDSGALLVNGASPITNASLDASRPLDTTPPLATGGPITAAPAGEREAQTEHFLQVAETALEPGAAASASPVVPVAEFEAEQLSLNASPVAEPGTWALLGLGIVGLGLARRRLASSRGGEVGR